MEFDYKINYMVSSDCYQVFRFGNIDKKHVSTILIQLPLLKRSMNGKEYLLKVQVYIIDADVVFLFSKKTLEFLGSNINMRESR